MAFRDEAIQEFVKKFGPTEDSIDPHGTIVRWRLKRERGLDLHVIIDSPEKQSEAHVLLSDPCTEARLPVRSLHLKRMDDVHKALTDIDDQWHLRGCWSWPPKDRGALSRH